MFLTGWDAEELTLSLFRWTFLLLPSLLSAHSFLVFLPHWIDPRYTFSLLTNEKKNPSSNMAVLSCSQARFFCLCACAARTPQVNKIAV